MNGRHASIHAALSRVIKLLIPAVLSACAPMTLGQMRPSLGPTTQSAPSATLDGNITAPPAGWLDFCTRNASDPYCRPIALTSERWSQLASVHRAVHALGARADADLFQRSDYWQAAGGGGGDCEDHALAARARLLELGWPPRSLRLAIAWTENGDYHAVLTVDVEHKGKLSTYVLDSRFTDVRGWEELTERGYRWDGKRRACPSG